MRKLLSVVLIALFIISCNSNGSKSDNSKKSILHTSTGKTYEMLVVLDNRSWESEIGDSIRSTMGQTAPWLFAKEGYYDISRVNENNFGNLYKMYRNILIIDPSARVKETKVTVSNNVYAKPQKIIKIKSPNRNEALLAYMDNYKNIISQFNQNEIIRVKNVYKGLHLKTLSAKIQEDFGFDMVIPKGFYIAKRKENFMWLRKETRHVSEGIMIYTRPYTDTSLLNVNNIIDYRNVITKNEIPGPIDSSYMKTSDVFPPYSKSVTFKGKYATLIRSWWDLEHYPMGGPFMSYTFVNNDATELITIDGYIYAPKKDKRDLLIHIEAILESFSNNSK